MLSFIQLYFWTHLNPFLWIRLSNIAIRLPRCWWETGIAYHLQNLENKTKHYKHQWSWRVEDAGTVRVLLIQKKNKQACAVSDSRTINIRLAGLRTAMTNGSAKFARLVPKTVTVFSERSLFESKDWCLGGNGPRPAVRYWRTVSELSPDVETAGLFGRGVIVVQYILTVVWNICGNI